MLRAVPDGWFSHSYTVFDRGGMPVARAELSRWWLWRGTTRLEVGGRRYQAHSKGRTGKEFVLEAEDGRVVAVAEQTRAWSDRFEIKYEGNRYELKKESAWGSAFVLSRDSTGLVGSVRVQSRGFFKREWTVDMPEELPLEMRVFILWLIILLWTRAAVAAGGAAGAAGV